MAASLLDQLAQLDKYRATIRHPVIPGGVLTEHRESCEVYRVADVDALCRSWQAEQGWRTIESAPKDEAVLVFCPPNSRCVARRGVYRYGFGGSWVSIPGSYSIKPTHWQPLPPFVASSTGTQE